MSPINFVKHVDKQTLITPEKIGLILNKLHKTLEETTGFHFMSKIVCVYIAHFRVKMQFLEDKFI